MEAPSEKHLEDYLWAHPEALGMVGLPPQYGPDIPMYRLHFRQFRLPSGIVDLIGADWRLVVFELKRGKITAQTFTQLMRYMRDIQRLMEDAIYAYTMRKDSFYEKLWDRWNGATFHVSDLLGGVLLGHDYEDENLLIACEACNVDVMIYDFDGEDYTTDMIFCKDTLSLERAEMLEKIREGHLMPILTQILFSTVEPEPKNEFVDFDIQSAVDLIVEKYDPIED
jgi:hypothetical protein